MIDSQYRLSQKYEYYPPNSPVYPQPLNTSVKYQQQPTQQQYAYQAPSSPYIISQKPEVDIRPRSYVFEGQSQPQYGQPPSKYSQDNRPSSPTNEVVMRGISSLPKLMTVSKVLGLLQDRDAAELGDVILKVSKPKKNVIEFLPIVYLSFFNLLAVFILSLLINHSLRETYHFEHLSAAQDVIFKAQKALVSPGFTEILQTIEICPGVDQTQKLGALPGTSRGCICPDMTTSEQMCLKPCKKVPSQSSQHYTIFEGQQLCATNGLKGFTSLKLLTEATGQEKNSVKFHGKSYQFQRDEGEPEFFAFEIAGSIPCYASSHQPMLQSQLSYPFLNVPYTGCDAFGTMDEESFYLGEIKLEDLLSQNKIDVKGKMYPFASKYLRAQDVLNLYLMRKPNLAQNELCKQFTSYPFDYAYSSCQFSQLLYKVLSLLGMCFFAVAVSFQIGSYIIKKTKKDVSILSYGKSDEIMERSTVIIAYWYVIFTFAALAIYMAVNYQKQGIHDSARLTSQMVDQGCVTNRGLIESIKTINHMSNNCVVKLNPLVWMLTLSQAVFVCLSFVIIKNTEKSKMQ